MTPLLVSISIITTLLPVLPLVIYWRTKRLQPDYVKYVAAILFLALMSDLQGMANFFLRYSEIATTVTNTFYGYLSFSLFVILYRSFFPKSWRNPMILFACLILLAGTYLIFSSKDPRFLSSGFMTITWVPIIVFALIFFFRMLKYPLAADIRQLPMFWINTAFLMYFSGSLVLQIFRDYLRIVSPGLFMTYYMFHNISWGILCILISIGLWQVRKAAN